MSRAARLVGCVALLTLTRPVASSELGTERATAPPSAPGRNEDLLRELQQVHGLSDE